MLDELLRIEHDGWTALSSAEPGVAADFYGALLRDDAMMLFPGGLVLDGREVILDSLAAQPWAQYRIEQPQVVALGANAAVLAYRVTARREGADPYSALVSSTYVHEGGTWRLAAHQHTPL